MESTPSTTSQPASKADPLTEGETKPVVVYSLAVLVVLAVFAVFVWPTRYRYDHTYNQVLVRIDRFTDEVSYLDLAKEGWQSLNPQKEDKVRTDLINQPSPTPYQSRLPDAPIPTPTRQSK